MKSRKIWKTVLIALGCALGAWAFGALLLPVLLPFFIGLAVSLLAESRCGFCRRGRTFRVRWRPVCACCCCLGSCSAGCFPVPPAVRGGGGSGPAAAPAGGKSGSAL